MERTLMNTPHVVAEPHILYLGTPVVLVSTVNADGTHNLAPISSAFWLGWRGVPGIAAASQTTRNLLRTGECVLILPSPKEVAAVDRIAVAIPCHRVVRRDGDISGYRWGIDRKRELLRHEAGRE